VRPALLPVGEKYQPRPADSLGVLWYDTCDFYYSNGVSDTNDFSCNDYKNEYGLVNQWDYFTFTDEVLQAPGCYCTPTPFGYMAKLWAYNMWSPPYASVAGIRYIPSGDPNASNPPTPALELWQQAFVAPGQNNPYDGSGWEIYEIESQFSGPGDYGPNLEGPDYGAPFITYGEPYF
jgi:hypothetical protein